MPPNKNLEPAYYDGTNRRREALMRRLPVRGRSQRLHTVRKERVSRRFDGLGSIVESPDEGASLVHSVPNSVKARSAVGVVQRKSGHGMR